MFGPNKKEIKTEMMGELTPMMRKEMESVKKEYLCEIQKMEKRLEDLNAEHATILEELKRVTQQNRELTQLLNEKQPGLLEVEDLKTKVSEMEKKLEIAMEALVSLGAESFGSIDCPTPSAEPAMMTMMHYLQ